VTSSELLAASFLEVNFWSWSD